MANIKSLQRAFGGGELSPEMFGRIDDSKYQSGLALCRNFVVTPYGPVENRAGFKFVRQVRQIEQRTRLIPFVYSADQTMIIEVGAGYFRFHTMGQTLVREDDSPYEIANIYAEQDLFDLHFVQSADVLTLVHQNYPPMELRRLGALDWRFTPISLLPTILPPSAPTVVGVGHTSVKYTYYYVVTAITADGSESSQSAEGNAGGNLFETGATVSITWAAVPSAARYRVYKKQGGLFGYIGESASLSLVDDNIAPDLGITPPLYDDVFNVSGRITTVPVTAGGSLYGTDSGKLLTISVVDGGLYYPNGLPITWAVVDQEGAGSGGTIHLGFQSLGVAGFRIVSASILTGGSGYKAPGIIFTGGIASVQRYATLPFTVSPLGVKLAVTDTGTGNGASLTAVITGGAITAVNVDNGGQEYFAPTVSVAQASGGSGATFGTPTVAGTGDYPRAVSYFEQRRIFAGTTDKPQSVFMTKAGTESEMSYSIPTRDDNRISFRVAAREASVIRHIVPLQQLLLLTASGEWRITSVNNDAITPSSVSVSPISYIGASNVQPVIVNNTLLYPSARGGHLREMAYSQQQGGFASGDLSIRSSHLFDNQEIVDMAYAKAPIPIVWAVSTSGELLGLTYVPEQQVGAWHAHSTDGIFESCAVVAEGREDVLYCVIKRTIDGVATRYIERMATRQFVNAEDAFFVDAGVTFTSGSPVTTVSGLTWLEGKTVSILADGSVRPQVVVTGGVITVEEPASKFQIGLPIVADIQTLPLAADIKDGAFAQARYKNLNKAWLRVYRSSGIFVGPDADHLREYKQRTTEPMGSAPALKSEEVEIMLTPQWSDSAQIFVRQSDPLPLTVVAMVGEVAIGA